jgi:hypothetical protein
MGMTCRPPSDFVACGSVACHNCTGWLLDSGGAPAPRTVGRERLMMQRDFGGGFFPITDQRW